MKRIFILYLLLIVILPIYGQTKRIAILDFENISGIAKYDGLGKAMSSMLISDIEANVSSKRLQLVERAQIQKVLKEQNFQASKNVNKNTAVQAGKLLGVNYLLVGDVYILNDQLIINARLTNTETGDIVFSKKQEGKTIGWLNLKTNIAKELATSLAQPFTEPTIPDKETNFATITTFAKAIEAKDSGDIKKSEELINMVKEFNPDFKYLEDLKVIIDQLKKSGGRVIDASSYVELKHNLNNQLTSKEEASVILSTMFNNFPNESINDINEINAYPRFDYKNFNNSQLISELLWLKEFIKKNKNQELNSQYAIFRIDVMLRIMMMTYCNNIGGCGDKNLGKLPIEKRYTIINEVIFEVDQILNNLPLKDVKSIRVVFYAQILRSFVDSKIGFENGNNENFYENLKKSENFQIVLKLFEGNLINKNGKSLFLDVFGEKMLFEDVKNWQQFHNFLNSIEINFSTWKSSGKSLSDYTIFE